jgi:hypothetical protein
MRRPALLAILAVSAVLAVLGSSSSAQDPDCTNRFSGPSSGQIRVDPDSGVVTGTDVGFALALDGNTDAMIWDSVRYQVDGPSGRVEVKPYDDRGNASFKPSKQGRHSVGATWTRYDCADSGRQTTTTGGAPAVPFDVVAGQRPGARFWTTRRPRRVFNHGGVRRVTPADAALHVMAKCPRDEVATHEPLTIDLYWTTNGRAASHSSRHVGTRGATGCYSSKNTRTEAFNSGKLNADASGEGAFIDVFEPLQVNVLVEVHSGAALVAARRATFRRSSTGERVQVRAA